MKDARFGARAAPESKKITKVASSTVIISSTYDFYLAGKNHVNINFGHCGCDEFFMVLRFVISARKSIKECFPENKIQETVINKLGKRSCMRGSANARNENISGSRKPQIGEANKSNQKSSNFIQGD